MAPLSDSNFPHQCGPGHLVQVTVPASVGVLLGLHSFPRLVLNHIVVFVVCAEDLVCTHESSQKLMHNIMVSVSLLRSVAAASQTLVLVKQECPVTPAFTQQIICFADFHLCL